MVNDCALVFFLFNSHVLMIIQMKWIDLSVVIVLLLMPPPPPLLLVAGNTTIGCGCIARALTASQLQVNHNNENILHCTRTQFTKSRCVLLSTTRTSVFKLPTLFRCSDFCSLPRVCVSASTRAHFFFIFALLPFRIFMFMYFCWIRWCIWPTGPVVCAHKNASRHTYEAEFKPTSAFCFFFRIKISRFSHNMQKKIHFHCRDIHSHTDNNRSNSNVKRTAQQ